MTLYTNEEVHIVHIEGLKYHPQYILKGKRSESCFIFITYCKATGKVYLISSHTEGQMVKCTSFHYILRANGKVYLISLHFEGKIIKLTIFHYILKGT